MPATPAASAEEGGGGERNALLAAIQRGASLKKVSDADEGRSKRRATIATPSTASGGGGGDLMSALKERMNLRRKGISGSRKEEGDAQATGDARPTLDKHSSMPTLLPSQRSGDDPGVPDAPISMAGMASALKAAASNRPDSGSEDEWSD